MDLGIRGKTALVAASSKGIGKACALGLAAEGCRIICCARNAGDLNATVAEIKTSTGVDAVGFTVDLRKPEEILHFAEQARTAFGPIDILVSNSGGPTPGTFVNLTESDWEAAYHSTLMCNVRLIQAILPDMQAKKWGRIINITSVSVKQPIDGLLLSNTFRAGVVGMAKTLANEVGQMNITVNTVAPGYTLTDRLDELFTVRAKNAGKSKQEVMEQLAQTVPLRRFAVPEEVAALVVFLASERAGYMTGTVIPVDGGVIKGI